MSDTTTNAKSLSIIVTKGTLDWAFPPFILATTAAARQPAWKPPSRN